MKFFEDLGATIGNGAKVAADKTKEVAGVASVKAKMSTAEANLGKLYRDLGKAYYEDNKESNAYAEITRQIKEQLAKVEELEKKLMEAQGCVKCPECGEMVPKDSSFCQKCGAKVNE